jgi:hypothetical protein
MRTGTTNARIVVWTIIGRLATDLKHKTKNTNTTIDKLKANRKPCDDTYLRVQLRLHLKE